MKKEIIAERRTRFLENLLQEAIINILAEQATPPAEPAPAAPPAAPAPEAAPPAEPAPAEAAETSDAEFTIEEMIERLNVIRGGKSFKDNDVYTKLVVFFSKLSDQQKNDLRQMLIDIGQAVINVPEEKAESPVEAPEAVAPAPATPAAAPAAPAPAV